MRQRHDVNRLPITNCLERPPNRFHERSLAEQLRNSELANRENQTGLQESKLSLQPARAVGNLRFIQHPIASLRFLAGKAAANRSKVDAITRFIFRPAERR